MSSAPYTSHSSHNHAHAMGKEKVRHQYTGAMELEKRLEERVTEFELSNGLHFIVMERHNAPIVSVHTYANVGAFDERDGQTGMDIIHSCSSACFARSLDCLGSLLRLLHQ